MCHRRRECDSQGAQPYTQFPTLDMGVDARANGALTLSGESESVGANI